MGMDNAIIIKQSYFNGIKVAIDAMNEFFGSGFTTKNFPTVGEEYDLDPTIERIITKYFYNDEKDNPITTVSADHHPHGMQTQQENQRCIGL
jgi:hypothetical protein